MSGPVIMSSRLFWSDETGKLRVKFDCGRFAIESDVGRGAVRSLQVSPEAMDALVLAWPRLRASVNPESQPAKERCRK